MLSLILALAILGAFLPILGHAIGDTPPHTAPPRGRRRVLVLANVIAGQVQPGRYTLAVA